jgi:TetR/AcrR family transcriptional regulator
MAEEATSSRKRDAARTKATILRSAVVEFAQNGPAGTRVDEVAIRAGVNKSLIYQYFGSKQELYADVLIDVLTRASERLGSLAERQSAAPEAGIRESIEGSLHDHLVLLEEMAEYPRLMAWENLEGGKTLARPQVRRAFLSMLEKLQVLLKGLEGKGAKLAGVDPRHVMLSALALDHYFILFKALSHDVLRVADDNAQNRDAWVRHCAKMFSGLLT